MAAGRSCGCSNLSHCRGKPADARCATVLSTLDPEVASTPDFTADVCFGTTVADDCRNVVYDPPDHLPVWDVARAAYQTSPAPPWPTGSCIRRPATGCCGSPTSCRHRTVRMRRCPRR